MGNHQFDAYAALSDLRRRYARYLVDTFGVRSAVLTDILTKHWTGEGESSFPLIGPTLVQGAFPFPPDRSLRALAAASGGGQSQERPLHPRTAAMLEGSLGFDLFSHQVETVRAASMGKTTVLSAGTGSGKTEAFLVSTIDALHWAEERGEDDLSEPGVRAIVVYPLNALINNQIERMQQLLARQTSLTFAFYTSRLPETRRRAEKWYEKQGLELPPACQLIDRQTVRGVDRPETRPQGPPHILVTNFSMLEYMLIRPLDRSFFLPERLMYKGRPRLRVIVLDEAHVYAGAQATEIHMLLRRAALRFGTTLETVQGIATSATLAQGASEELQVKALREYGASMFGKRVEDVAAVLGRQYLPVVAGPAREGLLTVPASIPPEGLVPTTIQTITFDSEGRPAELFVDEDAASTIARACVALGICSPEDVGRLEPAARRRPSLTAWHLLTGCGAIRRLRERLIAPTDGLLPKLDDVASDLFGAATEDTRKLTDSVLRIGAVARRSAGEHPILPTRMHVWLRAPSGVWVNPIPDQGDEPRPDWAWGAVHSSPPVDEQAGITRCELVVCDACGAEYLLAREAKDDWGNAASTGFITGLSDDVLGFCASDDGPESLPWAGKRGYRISVELEGRRVAGKCAKCGTPTSLRRIEINPRYAIGAVVDGIYPHLADHPATGGAEADGVRRLGRGRRLLTFSDSRQEAARVAHDVEASHNVGLNRSLLYRAIARASAGGPVSIRDVVDDLAAGLELKERAETAEVPRARGESRDFCEQLATLGLYQELARPAVDAPTIEGLGLVEVRYPQLSLCAQHSAQLGLPPEDWLTFLASVLDIARAQGAVAPPKSDMEQDLRERAPRFLGRPILLSSAEDPDDETEDGGRAAKRVALIGGKRARILAYAKRVATRLGQPDGGAERLLHAVWKAIEELGRTSRWLRVDPASNGYLIQLERLDVLSHAYPSFLEPLSGRIFPRSVRGVAPVGDRVAADLRPLSEAEREAWRARHAVRRVLDDELLGLRANEHTAQIAVDTLEEAERDFRAGASNLLACSTTMEMGVDLGGLTVVMMTNVPPGAANYWQRAGRAGRRADGTSLALSLALQRPHDQKVFDSPQAFLREPMVPPQVRFDLPALLSRHVNAHLLSTFFEEVVAANEAGNPMRAFGTVGEFFAEELTRTELRPSALELDPDAASLADVFLAWLDAKVLPSSASQSVQDLTRGTVLAGRTTGELASSCRDAVVTAAMAVRRDLQSIASQRHEQANLGAGAQDPSLLNALRHQERTIKNELLIAYLANKDVLPRFGFPLDVVRLETTWRLPDREPTPDQDRESPPGLRMERDLKLALSEYVPGTKVLAAKQLHRSAGLIPNWRSDTDAPSVRVVYYVHCERCGYLEERRTMDTASCTVCHHPVGIGLVDAPEDRNAELGPTPLRQYLVPSSFSVALGERPERPETFARPEKMPPAFVFVSSAGARASEVRVCDGLTIVFEPGTTIAFRSEGTLAGSRRRGYGYAICQVCGRAEPESVWHDKKLPASLVKHTALRGRSRCPGQFWRHVALGTTSHVDTLRFRLFNALKPALQPREDEEFFLSLAVCLQEIVSERLRVDRRTLSTSVGTWKSAEAGEVAHREAIVWDPSTSGILEHVLPVAGELVEELVKRLDAEANLLSYVRFDNQFMVAEGKFRLDLLRAHFLDDVRRQRFPSSSARSAPPATQRVEPLRSLAAQAFDLCDGSVDLVAPDLAPDAFLVDGILRLAHAAVLRRAGIALRLLVGAVPTGEQVGLAGALAGLIGAGAQVRVTSAVGVLGSFARVLYTVRGMRRALGAAMRSGATWETTRMCFGSDWGRGFVTLEDVGAAAQRASDVFAAAWDQAAVVTAESLKPNPASGVHYVHVPEGSRDPALTSLRGVLAARLGPLDKLGSVAKLLYVDRYVARSVVATWNLFDALHAFDYEPGAQGRVRCLVPTGSGTRVLRDVLGARPRQPLSPRELEEFVADLRAKKGVNIPFETIAELGFGGEYIRHGRKLLVAFAPGSRLRTLKVALELGADWINPQSTRNWSVGPAAAKQTHLVILENHSLDDEKDDRGRSEWTDVFP